MRGLAVLLTVASVWIIATGRIPAIKIRPISAPRPVVVATSLGAGVAAFLLTLGLLEVPAAAIAIAILGALIPIAVRNLRADQAARRRGEGWPDFIAGMRSQLSGGAALPEAFIDAARRTSMIDEGRVRQLAARLRTSGGFASILEELRDELGDPIADRVLTTAIAAHHTGGHRVGAILSALGHSVAEELQLRKAHDAAMTEQRLTAVVALIAPWTLLVLTIATNPQAAAAYRRGTGALIITIGVIATSAGFLLARRISRLSKPARVLQ